MATESGPVKKPHLKAKARIFIVDDHPMVRRGMAEMIGDEPDMEICGESGEMTDSIRQIETLKPSLALTDLSLKSGNGIELVKHLVTRFEGIKILVFSMHDELLYADRCLRAGAMGYVMKHEDSEVVIHAIRQVLKGKIYLSSRMTQRMLQGMSGKSDQQAGQSPVTKLSDRELEVFEMIGQGSTTSQIAARLSLSVKTIETYRENIKEKLSLSSGNELARYAMHWFIEGKGME